MLKPISLKLEERQVKLLEQISKATHIPKSALVRQGIDLILQRMKEDVISLEVRKEIDSLLKDDRDLLKRLSDA